jgi:hypothetical protein
MVFHPYVHVYAPLNDRHDKNASYKHHIHKAVLQCVLFDVLLERPSVKTLFHKYHIHKVFPQYVVYNEQHNYITITI